MELRSVGAHTVNELSYKWSGRSTWQENPLRTRSELGVTIPEIFAGNGGNLVPNIAIAGIQTFGKNQRDEPAYGNHTLGDTVTLQRGRHTVKTGGQVGFEGVDWNIPFEPTQGVFVFGAGGGHTAFQNFLRGNADRSCGNRCTYFESGTDVSNELQIGRVEAFAQDTWRVHPRVTVDAGVRYAYYPPVTDDANRLSTFSPRAYDPGRVPDIAYPYGPDFPLLVAGTGDLFNGVYAAGLDSPYGRAIYAADTNNLQPRLGMAWDVRGDSRLMLRAGYGIYFDQTQVQALMENTQGASTPFASGSNRSNAPLSDPAAGTTRDDPFWGFPLVFATSDSFVSPRWQHWNVGVQRRLYSRGVVDAGYVGRRGDHLLRYIDINKPQPGDVLAAGGQADLARPYLGLGQIIMRETTGHSQYHGVVTSFRHEGGSTGVATINYTYSRNRADATHDNSDIDDPQNPLDRAADVGDIRTDRRHLLTAYYVYDLPFGRDGGGWRGALLGGWQIAGITLFESGPAARLHAINWFGTTDGPIGTLRPNEVGEPSAGDRRGAQWFDGSAFRPPAGGTYGTAPLVPFRLPGRQQWDFSISKMVSLAASARLQFRADFVNAFNHTQFLDVNTMCVGTTTCSADFGAVTSARPPREVQLGARLTW